MIHVTAWPTLSSLRSDKIDRAPVKRHRTTVLSHKPSIHHRLAERMDETLADSVSVQSTQWVATPRGEFPVAFVVQGSGKRIALQFSRQTDADWSAEDALVLVYGGFDSLYRVHIGPGEDRSDDVLMALLSDHPCLFSHVGRLSVGRRASRESVWRMSEPPSEAHNDLNLDRLWVRRMRLHVATDWVAAFERELGAGHSKVA